jgi:hypothetical protein
MNELNDKAIDIKGKKYVLVSDRVIYFNETYKNGMIRTHLLSEPDSELVVVKAQVIPDMANPDRFFTGHSQAKWGDGFINKTSALENAETSAVGRALAMMGIGVIDSIASADEMVKAENTSETNEEIKEEIGDPCPKCKVGRLIAKTSTKTGKTFLKCDKGGWDKETNTATGCNYVNWRNPTVPKFDKKHPYNGETIPVEEYEK